MLFFFSVCRNIYMYVHVSGAEFATPCKNMWRIKYTKMSIYFLFFEYGIFDLTYGVTLFFLNSCEGVFFSQILAQIIYMYIHRYSSLLNVIFSTTWWSKVTSPSAAEETPTWNIRGSDSSHRAPAQCLEEGPTQSHHVWYRYHFVFLGKQLQIAFSRW